MASRPWTGHYLKGNAANQRPSMFVFVHCETTEEHVNAPKPYLRHKLHTGVAVAVEWRKGRSLRERWLTFVHSDVFWGWLVDWQRRGKVMWCVSHDAFRNLTVLNLWDKLNTPEYQTWWQGKPYKDRKTGAIITPQPTRGKIAIEGRPFHIETMGVKGRVNFTDIRNYYHSELDELAKMCDTYIYERIPACDRESMIEHRCRWHVETVKRSYLNLLQRWEREKNGNWQFSASGLAHSNYRHKFMKEPIAIHNHAEAIHYEEACCYGGEVRCWYRGTVNRPLIEYDMNSSYGWAMVDRVYPTALIDHFTGNCYGKLGKYADKYGVVAEVTLRTDVDCYPCSLSGNTVYPVGEFRTVLCGVELLEARERQHIKQVHALSIYTMGNIFTPYVLHWWEEKSKCKRRVDKAGEKFAKMMINSLPAKFAQHYPVWREDKRILPVQPWKYFPWKHPDTGEVWPARSVGWQGQYASERKLVENAFPAIFAYVTAYIREHMRYIRSLFPANMVYYQDTDSLIILDCNQDNSTGLLIGVGDGLGQFKVKGRYSSATFRGPKNYTVDDRNVIAGVKETDTGNGDNRFSGVRYERASSLFHREHDHSIRAIPVDLEFQGQRYSDQYGEDGWLLPLKLNQSGL